MRSRFGTHSETQRTVLGATPYVLLMIPPHLWTHAAKATTSIRVQAPEWAWCVIQLKFPLFDGEKGFTEFRNQPTIFREFYFIKLQSLGKVKQSRPPELIALLPFRCRRRYLPNWAFRRTSRPGSAWCRRSSPSPLIGLENQPMGFLSTFQTGTLMR